LITGGLVTGLKAGLAVPDWPTSYGHNMLLYPLAEMSGGKYVEHAHRLYGMLVGVTAITVAVSLFFFDQRSC
jgi:cytochrome c oxidase assembly protein subunit 15